MIDFCSFSFGHFPDNVIHHSTEIYRPTQNSLIHFDLPTVTIAISIKKRFRKSRPMRSVVISEVRVLIIVYPKVLSTFDDVTFILSLSNLSIHVNALNALKKFQNFGVLSKFEYRYPRLL